MESTLGSGGAGVMSRSERLTKSWAASIGLGLVALAVYLANGHDIGTDDTLPACLIPHTLARGDGLRLDHFQPVLEAGPGDLVGCVSRKRGHIVSRHPVGAGILAAPLVWVQFPIYDRIRPIWRAHPSFEWRFGLDMAKHAAAAIAAGAVVLLHRLLCQIGLARGSIPASIALAFGSPHWTISSQSLWQHGPAAFTLTAAMLCLAAERPGRARVLLGGLFCGALLAIRIVDLPLALVLAAWVARHNLRRLAWFLGGVAAVSGWAFAYNYHWFGTLLGGQSELEAVHPAIHNVASAWNGNPLPGALGTLFSPARGLFVFAPWTALALAAAPASAARLGRMPLIPWMLWGLVPYFVMLSCYSVWWGGFCYGPRYWSDVMPLFAILLACAMEWFATRFRVGVLIAAVLVLWSMALQALGAFYYPSSWNLAPRSVDLHHERLWDWGDCEVTRCLYEKVFVKK